MQIRGTAVRDGIGVLQLRYQGFAGYPEGKLPVLRPGAPTWQDRKATFPSAREYCPSPSVRRWRGDRLPFGNLVIDRVSSISEPAEAPIVANNSAQT